MADDKSNKIVTKEFIQERDMRIFKMRQAGTSTQEIARRFGISTSAASKAVQRTLEKMNREVLMAYPEVLRMELERLDSLQQAIWPMTQHRKMTMDDGNEVAVEPDLKAIQQVLSIMDRRTKLLGMDQVNVSVQMDVQSKNNEVIKATLAGSTNVAAGVDAFNPETEARQLLELMGISGVLPPESVKQMLADHEIVDAEIIDYGENDE
jgi:transposase-like protein